MFEAGYKHLNWNDQAATHERDWRAQGLSLGIAAGIGATAFGASIMPRSDGHRYIDDVAKYARTVGNLTPFQIGNTFRIPEWLSPFTSPVHQRLAPGRGGTFSAEIGVDYLKSYETYSYLKTLSNMDPSQLAAAGITPGMKPGVGTAASHILFEKGSKADINGKLFSVVDGKRHLLSNSVAMLQFSGETAGSGDLLAKNEPVNKVAKSVFSTMDMWGQGNWKDHSEGNVFAHRIKKDEIKRPGFIPIPGIGASPRGATYLQSTAAFSMERFNQLVTNTGTEVFGQNFATTAKKLGFDFGVRPGPALQMYGRFGIKAAGVLGLGVVAAESDWLRRQGGLPGHVAVSAGVSFGLGAVAAKAGFGAKASFMAGLASFAGQMILPGFDQGILPGIASTYAVGTELRASSLNPASWYRRTLEGTLPGVSGVGMGMATGIGLALASYAPVPGSGRTLPSFLLDKYGAEKFGIAKRTSKGMDIAVPKSIGQHFWDLTLDYAEKNTSDKQVARIMTESKRLGGHTTMGMRTQIMGVLHRAEHLPKVSEVMNTLWSKAEEKHKSLEKVNPLNSALQERLQEVDLRYTGKNDIVSKGLRQVESLGEQVRHSFFGANIAEEGMSKFMKGKGMMHAFGRAGLLFGAGFVGHGILTGGLLGSTATREELSDIYSGKQLVEIQKNRLWEMGGSPNEGMGHGQFRPHWYPIMMNRVRQAGIWGSDEDKIDPMGKFVLSNFTNYLEKKNYYDRPYPISAPAFSNIPIIGGVLGATVGQLIKPAQIMHAGEWIQGQEGGGLEYASVHEGWKREPAYNLGANQKGVPVSPFNAKSVFSDFNTQFRDLGGLVGWVSNTASNMITGQDTYFQDDPRLADSGMMTSHRRHFWDMSLGGGGPFGEALRRIIPPLNNDYERVNPIMNTMPQWLDRQFHWGDPYAEIQQGEAVLPGQGYAKLHPELQGVDPEDYPLIYRYDILSQVSARSSQLRDVRDAVYFDRQRGAFTPDQEAWIDRIDKVVAKQWNVLDPNNVDKNAIQLPGISRLTQAAWGGLREKVRSYVAPVEYLIPGGFRPVQKFLGGDRDAIERYEWERMYGSTTAFWDKPMRDWIRPSMYSLANLMGYEGKPAWRVEADATNKLFDELEFNKWMTLAQQAQMAGDTRQKIQFEYQAANTRMGVNPMGNPMSLYWSLPAEDRAYFNSFAFAQGKDRERILEMLPSDQAGLYKTLWSRVDTEDPRLWAGNPTDPDQQYMYRQFAGMDKSALPPTDWIGNNPDVDMRDIKIRYIDELAKDYRDFGEWECLPPWQEVLTGLSIRETIENLQPNDRVWQWGHYFTILGVHKRMTEEKLYVVSTYKNKIDTMTATGNHLVYAWKPNYSRQQLAKAIYPQHNLRKIGKHPRPIIPSWIRIEDLVEGDYLVSPIGAIQAQSSLTIDLVVLMKDVPNLRYDDEHVWIYYQNKQYAGLLNRYVEITPDLAWLVGYYAAEGWVDRNSQDHPNRIGFASNWDEEADLRLIAMDTLIKLGCNSFQEEKANSNCGIVRSSGPIAWLLAEYFLPGKKDTKHLMNADVLFRSEEHVCSFLIGLFSGDASKGETGSLLSNTSEQLVRTAFDLLCAIGIPSSLNKQVRQAPRKDQYQVYFSRGCDKSRYLHKRIVRSTCQEKDPGKKSLDSFVYNGEMYLEIKDIATVDYSGFVYDLHVDEKHSYRSPIGLYHNSSERKAYSQPFLEGSTGVIHQQMGYSRGGITRNLRELFGGPGTDLRVFSTNANVGTLSLDYNDDRRGAISQALGGYLGNY